MLEQREKERMKERKKNGSVNIAADKDQNGACQIIHV
jgi:hypothetical protein